MRREQIEEAAAGVKRLKDLQEKVDQYDSQVAKTKEYIFVEMDGISKTVNVRTVGHRKLIEIDNPALYAVIETVIRQCARQQRDQLAEEIAKADITDLVTNR